MPCEDYPCCGHESGCCPSFGHDGQQENMICTCGAVLPVYNRFSICDDCMDACAGEDGWDDHPF